MKGTGTINVQNFYADIVRPSHIYSAQLPIIGPRPDFSPEHQWYVFKWSAIAGCFSEVSNLGYNGSLASLGMAVSGFFTALWC